MSVNPNTPSGKVQQKSGSSSSGNKRHSSSMNRPQSTIEGESGGYYTGLIRSEYENEALVPGYKVKLHGLFRQIEREFELLYQENQNCEFLKRFWKFLSQG